MVFTPAEAAAGVPVGHTPHGRSFKQAYPHKLNHYRFEDFFTLEGMIDDWYRARNILASEDFIVALIKGLEQKVGSASTVVMHNIGKVWGKQDRSDTATFWQNEGATARDIETKLQSGEYLV